MLLPTTVGLVHGRSLRLVLNGLLGNAGLLPPEVNSER